MRSRTREKTLNVSTSAAGLPEKFAVTKWKENLSLCSNFPPPAFAARGRRRGLLFTRVPSKTVRKIHFLFLFSLGISSLPLHVLSDIRNNLQVMVNRLALRFDGFDADARVCVCMSERPRAVSRYRKSTVEGGPGQFRQVAHYNARSTSLALWHVMTDGFSAASQNKQCPHTQEKHRGLGPAEVSRWWYTPKTNLAAQPPFCHFSSSKNPQKNNGNLLQ